MADTPGMVVISPNGRGGLSLPSSHCSFVNMTVNFMRPTLTVLVYAALASCAVSKEQGPYGPHLDRIAEVNAELGKWSLTLTYGVPKLIEKDGATRVPTE